jgi:hypothetical protein
VLQEPIQGDYWLTTADRLYGLYFLTIIVACLLATARVFRIWRVGRQPLDATSCVKYSEQIQESILNLQQWRGFLLITWGIVVAVNFREAWQGARAATANGYFGRGDVSTLLFNLRNVTTSLIAALVASALLYLARWYLLKRLERVKQNRTTV